MLATHMAMDSVLSSWAPPSISRGAAPSGAEACHSVGTSVGTSVALRESQHRLERVAVTGLEPPQVYGTSCERECFLLHLGHS